MQIRPARFVVLACFVLAAWASSMTCGFVWIDHVEIEQGGYRISDMEEFRQVWVRSLDDYLERRSGATHSSGGYLRPVYALSLTLDWAFWQARPWAWHAENIF